MMKTVDAQLPLAIRRAATLETTLWSNGRGASCEVAICPESASMDNFVWRASMAQVSVDGAFSTFPGIDRTLVLLGGAGMELDLTRHVNAGSSHALREPLSTFGFEGETPPEAKLVDGPTHDFNLMVRREFATGQVAVWRGPGQFVLPDDLVLLFVVHGRVALTGVDLNDPEPIPLEACDSVKLNGIARLNLSISLPEKAVVLAVRVQMHDDDADTGAPTQGRDIGHAR
ncbi:HutD/Ves family protein [Robbsia andropogonis]|uniref:HutD/Ves family protein n=1 Tax=Robbsia andropogonis TaxID=28092 RepID=UPI000685EE55|nr:HutD family protein [Robbsia andropogonis]